MHHLRHKFFRDDEYLDEFADFLSTVVWSDRSPLNTEMLFLWSMVRSTKPELFVESGTFKGYSADFICKALEHNDNDAEFITYGFDLENCLSFAKERLEKYPFARVVEGDSRKLLKAWPREMRPAAFFIDGPKGRNMIPLFLIIVAKFSNIRFIAVHDSERESGSANRHYLTAFFGGEYPITFCDSDFQDKLSHLDSPLIGRSGLMHWQPYQWNGMKRRSYGTETGYVLPALGKVDTAVPRMLFYLYRQFRFRVYYHLGSVYLGIRNCWL